MNLREQLLRIAESIPTEPSGMNGKIGIAITEHNRYAMFKKCYDNVLKYAPEGAEIVVVDDASRPPVKEATYRFDKNVGIAVAKNKCLELLYKRGCEHFFLLDSDTWPTSESTWWPYINSPQPHLMYIFKDFKGEKKINDTLNFYNGEGISAHTHARGCMLYYHRSVLDKVGGMDPVFGKWGFEHVSHSDRIFMSGLTMFRYMDTQNSSGLWYSDDENNDNRNTTVSGSNRLFWIEKNKKIYEERRFKEEHIPFYNKENIFLTCYLNTVEDTQSGRKWEANIELLMPLINSLKNTKLVVLTDCLDEKNTDKVEFVKVSVSINPYFQRWILYQNYLTEKGDDIGNVFCIDGTDVEVLNEPDWESLGDYLYIGDEPKPISSDANTWLEDNHKSPLIADFISRNRKLQMLNAGIIGGSRDNVLLFARTLLDKWVSMVNEAFHNNVPDAGTTDMGLFNFVARTFFPGIIKTGRYICTTFKANERNDYTWFKHK